MKIEMEKAEEALKEFNKFFSPEARAEILFFDNRKSVLKIKFSGSFCRTCGYYDYFDDLKYSLKEHGIDAEIKSIRENHGGATVSYVIIKEREKLIEEIENLKNKNEVRNIINRRIREFEEKGKGGIEEIFSELCFCILTANFNAEKSIEIQEKINRGFIEMSREELVRELKNLGHRYWKKRAEYICEAREKINELDKALKKLEGEELRRFIVNNFRGIGYKEASHFLRNIGYKNYAIIDFHLLDLLFRYSYIAGEERSRSSMTAKRYFKIEDILREIAEKSRMTLAELDLYLWYMETGKVLK